MVSLGEFSFLGSNGNRSPCHLATKLMVSSGAFSALDRTGTVARVLNSLFKLYDGDLVDIEFYLCPFLLVRHDGAVDTIKLP